MGFRFRQFEVEDIQSSMRVGSDSMLLGAWSNPGIKSKILDIGTGCGVLALMIAQKSTGIIDAIEIDKQSINEAQSNFLNSPWTSRINPIHDDVAAYSRQTEIRYDFIISNPPFFKNSLKSPELRKNQARHDIALSNEELIKAVDRLLSITGRFSTILPANIISGFIGICEKHNLHAMRRTDVFPKPDSRIKRVLMEFSRYNNPVPIQSEMIILNSEGKFSLDYLELTSGYHQF
ncbi:MAG: methyltransferase [Bacteroidota bacterium]